MMAINHEKLSAEISSKPSAEAALIMPATVYRMNPNL